jgi:hypothetical protein
MASVAHSQTQNQSTTWVTRVVESQGPVAGHAKAVRRLGRAGAVTGQEEGGGAQDRAERRQDAAVVVATTSLGLI